MKDFIKKYRNFITVVLSLAGIGIMAYYDYCDTTCSYLQGDIFGIDLKWVGIAYMAAIIVFAVLNQSPFVRTMLAGGLGWKFIFMPFRYKMMFTALFVLHFRSC